MERELLQKNTRQFKLIRMALDKKWDSELDGIGRFARKYRGRKLWERTKGREKLKGKGSLK